MTDALMTEAAPAVPQALINIGELAARLAIRKGTLYNWVYLRRIPYIKAGGCVRFDYEAVIAALRRGTLEKAGRRWKGH